LFQVARYRSTAQCITTSQDMLYSIFARMFTDIRMCAHEGIHRHYV